MEDYRPWTEGVIEKIRVKMAWVSEKNRDKIPYTTDEHGDYDDRADDSRSWNVDDGINWWTNGFWGGMKSSELLRVISQQGPPSDYDLRRLLLYGGRLQAGGCRQTALVKENHHETKRDKQGSERA